MNILIKLTCLIGLVIAPILGSGSHQEPVCGSEGMPVMECTADMGGCDMSKCATMTKDECAAMCDSNGCSPEDKAKCMALYGADGKYIAPSTDEKTIEKKVIMKKVDNGKVEATVTTTVNGKETTEIIKGTEAEVKAKVDALK